MLTGDKVETAINIGFSCHLLNKDQDLITIDKPKGMEDKPSGGVFQKIDEEFKKVSPTCLSLVVTYIFFRSKKGWKLKASTTNIRSHARIRL